MSSIRDPLSKSPAFELSDLIKEWEIIPAGVSPLQCRNEASGVPYHQAVRRALELADEIDAYLDERELRHPGRGGDRSQLDSIRRGVLSIDHHVDSISGDGRRFFQAGDLHWLNHLGLTWHRTELLPSVEHVEAILTVTEMAEDLINKLPDEQLQDAHRAYLIELCAAVRAAVRDIPNSGGARTARLALQLRGALETFLPASEETDNFSARLGKAIKHFSIYYLAPAAAQITAGAVTYAIAPPR